MNRNALLIIDVQEEYMKDYVPDQFIKTDNSALNSEVPDPCGSGLTAPQARPSDSLLTAINKRILRASEHNEMIVYVKNVRKLRSGTSIYDFADGLLVCSSNIIFKEKASAFSDGTLDTLLRNNSITELEFIGIDGCGCVAASALDARRYGYGSVLNCEFIGTKNKVRFAKVTDRLKKEGVSILSSIDEAFIKY